ncbi:MAG TPA: hypothetical protein VGM03_10355 [Phycisphaerae bacterium]
MPDIDREKLIAAWRDASDADLARAVKSQDSCPPDVLPIVRTEIARRQISDADLQALCASRVAPVFDAFRRSARSVVRWLLSHRSILAAGVGVGLGLLRDVLWRWNALGSGWSEYLLLTICAAAILATNFPFRSYRRAVETSFAGWLSFGAYSLIRLRAFATMRMRILLFAIAFLIVYAAVGALLGLLAVRIRHRRWPIYGLDQCHHCGYDLTLNVSGRCPECGQPITTSQPGPHQTGPPEV